MGVWIGLMFVLAGMAGASDRVIRAEATPARCPENPTVLMSVPTPAAPDLYTVAGGEFAYFVSADGESSVYADQRFEVGENKFGFNKPDGATATVSGRRVDGDAPPIGVEQFPPGSYPRNFEVMALMIPEPGCWAVTISAGSSTLTFFAEVALETRPLGTPTPPAATSS